MPNIASLLKSEITRLARKEAKALTDPISKSNAGYRRDIAALKRQVADLERQMARTSRTRDTAPTTPDGTKTRFTAKGLKSHRARLGLSAGDYGRLAGVSGQSIYGWESGKTVPRQSQVAALAALRRLGKREARARL